MRRSLLVSIPLLILAAALPTAVLAAEPPSSLADCEEQVRRHPDARESYLCFTAVARRHNRFREASLRLEALLSVEPGNHLARLALADIEARRGKERAEGLFREAIEGLSALGDTSGEIAARLELSFFLNLRGRREESELQLSRAEENALESADPIDLAWVRTNQAWRAYHRAEYGPAERILLEVERDVFSAGPVLLRSTWLSAMGATLWAMARYEESFQAYARQAEILHAAGDLYEEAVARSNMGLLRARLLDDQDLFGKERQTVIHLNREVLEIARAGGNRSIEAKTHLYLGQIIGDPEAARVHYRTALATYRETGHAKNYRFGLRLLGENLILSEPREVESGFPLLEEALKSAEEAEDLRDVAYAWTVIASSEWFMYRELDGGAEWKARAIRSSLATLDAIETIRDRQPDSVVRARTFSPFAFIYNCTAGNLLWPPDSDPAAEDLALAFQVMERMRGRVSIEELDAARATTTLSPEGPVAEEHRSVLERIAGLNQLLLDPGIPEIEKRDAKRDLERFEAEERSLRADLARIDSAYARLRTPQLAELSEVRDALAEEEALLIFQIGEVKNPSDHFRGGSWLMVLTRPETRVYFLPERPELEDRVQLLLGLFAQRDGSEIPGVIRLYRDLLARPLEEMPAGITRLLLVPDGILHRLPFAALRPAPDAPSLGERFRLSLAPSATTWLHWRTAVPSRSTPGLALVDPQIPGLPRSAADQVLHGTEQAAALRAFSDAVPSSPLPLSRREAKAMQRYLGGGTRTLAGAEATEAFVKRADLSRYGIVHFGAHAVVDEGRPERSAVFLAPGDDKEDGLLQIREIVQLDLDGRVVVLSACRSAAGALLRGEGVLSLARAFFVAGAHAVIGSLWPMRDDEAAALFEDFYRHIGEGKNLAAALTAARRDRIRAGAPAAAWAGVVLLGDGDLVPFPEGASRSRLPARILFLGLLALAAGGAVLAVVLHRRSSTRT